MTTHLNRRRFQPYPIGNKNPGKMRNELEDALENALGKQEVTHDEVSAPLARRLAATLDQTGEELENGASLPDGWYVILFTPTAPTSVLEKDGHARASDFLPRLPLPRRMFAGRKVYFEQPLEIGAQVERVSTISKGEIKEGRSGLLAFLTITHDMNTSAGLCVREEQTLVYRAEATGAAKPSGPPKQAPQAPTDCPWTDSATPTPATLLRYSAVTFNAHRIHYDETYAREEEGYPERIVNGGLTAILLIEMARRNRPGPLKEFGVTNRRALYVNQPISLLGMPEGDTAARLWAADDSGAIASEATLTWKA